ncbi:uncharacterized protein LY79DRAFT_97500 [Colletotrichum navitas]|uniref:Uncharacterized protein n=1 Tax=Colletotrichum navitas TaxID=681940 RepID=A0AAD8PL25_9PEZI|nr:uncharacterized protein LY79DRAFT_97500 [Colletotrichum navitas]KAK1566321.1 hypothetical protein LY79DRAFT_97500 [Colletotrichum navitas]
METESGPTDCHRQAASSKLDLNYRSGVVGEGVSTLASFDGLEDMPRTDSDGTVVLWESAGSQSVLQGGSRGQHRLRRLRTAPLDRQPGMEGWSGYDAIESGPARPALQLPLMRLDARCGALGTWWDRDQRRVVSSSSLRKGTWLFGFCSISRHSQYPGMFLSEHHCPLPEPFHSPWERQPAWVATGGAPRLFRQRQPRWPGQAERWDAILESKPGILASKLRRSSSERYYYYYYYMGPFFFREAGKP